MTCTKASAYTTAWLSSHPGEVWKAVREWSTAPWLDSGKHLPLLIARPLSGHATELGSTRLLVLDDTHLYEQLTVLSDAEYLLKWQLMPNLEYQPVKVASFLRYASSLHLTAGSGNFTHITWRGEAFTEPQNVHKIRATMEGWYWSMLHRLQEYLSQSTLQIAPQPPIQSLSDAAACGGREDFQAASVLEPCFCLHPLELTGQSSLGQQTSSPKKCCVSHCPPAPRCPEQLNPALTLAAHAAAQDGSSDPLNEGRQLSPSEAWRAARVSLMPNQQFPDVAIQIPTIATQEGTLTTPISMLSSDSAQWSPEAPCVSSRNCDWAQEMVAEQNLLGVSKKPCIGEFPVTWNPLEYHEGASSAASSVTMATNLPEHRRYSLGSRDTDSGVRSGPRHPAESTSSSLPFMSSYDSSTTDSLPKSRSGSMSSETSSIRQPEVFSSFVCRSFEATRRSLDRSRLSTDSHRMLPKMSQMGSIAECPAYSTELQFLPPWNSGQAGDAFGNPTELQSRELDQRALLFASSLPQVHNIKLRSQLFNQAFEEDYVLRAAQCS